MMAVDIGFDPALNLGNLGTAPEAGGARSGSLGGSAAAQAAGNAAGGRGSFHSLLRDAGRSAAPADKDAALFNRNRAADTDPAANAVRECQPLETGCQPADIPQGADSAWDALAQLVQILIHASGKVAEPDEVPPAEDRPEADEGEDGDALLRFIDLLKQLQAPRGESAGGPGEASAHSRELRGMDSANLEAGEKGRGLIDLLNQLRTIHGNSPAESSETLSQVRELLHQATAGVEGQKANGLPGRIHQWLVQAHDAVPGIPWGRLAQLVTGQGASADEPAVPQRSGQSGMTPAVDGPRDDVGQAGLQGLLREALGKSKPDAAGRPEAAASPEASTPPGAERSGAAPNDAKSLATAVELEQHRSPGAMTAGPTREAILAAGREEARVQEGASPVEGSRQPATEPAAPLAAPPEGGSDDGLSTAALRDARTGPAPEPALDKSAAGVAAPKLREAGGMAARGDVVEQIVQRAAVHLKSDQGEARIDLKPEFLGQVRMQIVTDNQQVTVRIVTELPMVRDLIEQNLHQLKADLQQQGLQVERVEVSVADDPRRDAGRQGRAGGRRNGRGLNEVDGPAAGSVEQRAREIAAYWNLGGRTTINMFA